MSAVPKSSPAANDPDSLETQEWLDALEAVLDREGPERAHFLLEKLIDLSRRSGAYLPFSANTAYINTIPVHLEERSPGDAAMEERIRSICRWNAMIMVAKVTRSRRSCTNSLTIMAPMRLSDAIIACCPSTGSSGR